MAMMWNILWVDRPILYYSHSPCPLSLSFYIIAKLGTYRLHPLYIPIDFPDSITDIYYAVDAPLPAPSVHASLWPCSLLVDYPDAYGSILIFLLSLSPQSISPAMYVV